MDWNWYFEYEQVPPRGNWGIYKLDYKWVEDGAWHALDTGSRALYRTSDSYLQVINPGKLLLEKDIHYCRDQIERAGRLDTDDELEICISKHPSGFEMWSYWVYQNDGIVFRTFNSEEFNDAYRRLCELEDQFVTDKALLIADSVTRVGGRRLGCRWGRVG